jgi:hypothetical protein
VTQHQHHVSQQQHHLTQQQQQQLQQQDRPIPCLGDVLQTRSLSRVGSSTGSAPGGDASSLASGSWFAPHNISSAAPPVTRSGSSSASKAYGSASHPPTPRSVVGQGSRRSSCSGGGGGGGGFYNGDCGAGDNSGALLASLMTSSMALGLANGLQVTGSSAPLYACKRQQQALHELDGLGPAAAVAGGSLINGARAGEESFSRHCSSCGGVRARSG